LSIALYGKPIAEHHLPRGITQFICDLTQVNVPQLNPGQAGRYTINPCWRDRRQSWP